uniref:Small ribosomal subunit protein uS3m n=1 Tax=Orbilia brochopaga TaxID=3140254 RepID=A0A481ZMI8_9PEZI|nr:hypothetical protein [Drechslerella brochopaga]QBL02499.1 hypothetical protein [Drechslerella brochopaga]
MTNILTRIIKKINYQKKNISITLVIAKRILKRIEKKLKFVIKRNNKIINKIEKYIRSFNKRNTLSEIFFNIKEILASKEAVLKNPLRISKIKFFLFINSQISSISLLISFSYLIRYNLKKIYIENLGVLSQIGRDRLYPESFIIMDYIKKKDKVLFTFLTKYFFKKHKYNYRINKLKIWLLSYLNRYSKKKIEINLIRLKYIYLNSNMVAEYITRKLITKRISLLKVKRKIFTKAKLVLYNKYILDNLKRFNINDINFLGYLSSLRLTNYSIYFELLKRIKYKFISGIRLIATGRLTRRNIAARSVKYFCYKGSLKNIDSSFKFLSVAALRGDWRPNLEYTVRSDTAKTGSFAVKTWLSFYSYSTSSTVSPVKKYINTDTQKLEILKENKGKSGVYRWINIENGNSYVGSSVNLGRRFLQYYSIGSLLIENKTKKIKVWFIKHY